MQEKPNNPENIKNLGSQISDAMDSIKSNIDINQILNQVLLIDNAAQSVAKSFGVSKEFSKEIRVQFSEARKDVALMGGTLNDILKIQLESNESLGRNVILQSDTIEKIFATTKVTGQESKTLIANFKDVGISAFNLVKNMEKVVDTAKSSGVNAQIVSAKVVSNLESLNRFNFQGGVDGLAKMAAQATGLRIDMKSTLDFAEKVFDPEGAIETAAALQRLGVTQSDLLDPLRLLDLSQNDPAELQNQLVQMTKQFVRLNEAGNFEIAPGAKRQLREISKELGISYQELTKMAIGSSELEDKLNKIKFPNTFTEEQKTMIANMAEMGSEGEYKLILDDKELGLDEAIKKLSGDEELLKKFMKDAEPMDMEELAKKQLGVAERTLGVLNSIANRSGTALAASDLGDAMSSGFERIFTKTEEVITKKMTDILGGKKVEGKDELEYSNKMISKSLDSITGSLTKGINNVVNGTTSLEDVVGVLTNSFKGFQTSGFLEKFGNSIENTTETLKPFNETLTNLLKPNSTTTTTGVKDFIRLPGQTIQPLPEDTLFGGTGFENLMERLGGQKTTSVQNTETKTTADINLNIKIDAPSQIDTNQLILAFNNQGLREKMIESMKEAMFNNGLTSPTSSKTKLMNPYVG
jgi:hypothetical protein